MNPGYEKNPSNLADGPREETIVWSVFTMRFPLTDDVYK